MSLCNCGNKSLLKTDNSPVLGRTLFLKEWIQSIQSISQGMDC